METVTGWFAKKSSKARLWRSHRVIHSVVLHWHKNWNVIIVYQYTASTKRVFFLEGCKQPLLCLTFRTAFVAFSPQEGEMVDEMEMEHAQLSKAPVFTAVMATWRVWDASSPHHSWKNHGHFRIMISFRLCGIPIKLCYCWGFFSIPTETIQTCCVVFCLYGLHFQEFHEFLLLKLQVLGILAGSMSGLHLQGNRSLFWSFTWTSLSSWQNCPTFQFWEKKHRSFL